MPLWEGSGMTCTGWDCTRLECMSNEKGETAGRLVHRRVGARRKAKTRCCIHLLAGGMNIRKNFSVLRASSSSVVGCVREGTGAGQSGWLLLSKWMTRLGVKLSACF